MFPMDMQSVCSIGHQTGYFFCYLSQSFHSSAGCSGVTLDVQAEITVQKCCVSEDMCKAKHLWSHH